MNESKKECVEMILMIAKHQGHETVGIGAWWGIIDTRRYPPIPIPFHIFKRLVCVSLYKSNIETITLIHVSFARTHNTIFFLDPRRYLLS